MEPAKFDEDIITDIDDNEIWIQQWKDEARARADVMEPCAIKMPIQYPDEPDGPDTTDVKKNSLGETRQQKEFKPSYVEYDVSDSCPHDLIRMRKEKLDSESN